MWLFLGFLFGGFVFWLAGYLKGKGSGITWYEWILGLIGIALLLFTIQNYFASYYEFWPKAASMFLLISGLPAVIFLAITGLLIARNTKKAV